MPREKDPFWKYVTFLNENNSKWRCNFCGQKYGGGATRIKAHLAGIGGFGIKGCESVNANVRADAEVALMPKKVMDSCDRGVSEERIQGNVIAAPTSTSDPPNVGEGTNLQLPQGVSPLTPRSNELMEQMWWAGATSDSSAFPLPYSSYPDSPNEQLPFLTESLTLTAQQNPSAPLPSQNRQLLDNTFQNELQGSIFPGPIASATQLSNMATANTPQHSSQPLQSDCQCGYVTGPSTSEGMPKGAPAAGASSFQYDRPTVPHSNEPLPSCNEECGTETSSYPLRESMDIDPRIATRVDLQVLEGEANMAGPSSSQASVPPRRQSVPHHSINLQTAHQNPAVPSSSWQNHLVTRHPQDPMDMDPRIPSSSQAPNNNTPPPQIPPCGTGLIGLSSLPVLDTYEGVPMTSHPNTRNNFEEIGALKRKLKRLDSREADIRDELKFAASLSLKKQRTEVANWLADAEKLRTDFHSLEAASDCLPPHQQVDILMGEAEDLMRQSNFPNGLFMERETKFSKFSEVKMAGEAFQTNTTEILEYLVGNQISRLGIYGMGGVGKTTIMKHIHNRLLEKENYGDVMWITVSQDFSPKKLQDDIWAALSLGALHENDVSKRAAMLSDRLTERGKSTIILDDVWERFDLKEVGIPVRADGIKLVLTTRSFEVCCQMHCQEKIRIEPLSHIEAKSLFLEELGSEVALNSETEAIVKSIVEECAGLPLAVITMAGSMRGMTHLFEWKDSLEKLRESSMGQCDMEKEVLMKLKFSYDRLGNYEVQQCFLSCALYPEDEYIDKFELIEFFIDQGLIGGLNTREKQHNRGHTILNKLGNVCLLEDDGEDIKMHDLIRDMALQIMSATSIVIAGKRLTRIPPEEDWTDALAKVSLMENNIREFPLDLSPNCPKLSTLLLKHSLSCDVVIPDSFFKHLRKLEVLNLSGCELRELPDSISDLVNLRALLLRDCSELCRIPYLGKLRSLRKLDARGCESLEAVEGLGMLVNLRYLDLTDTSIKRLPKGTLGGLLNLEYLRVEATVDREDLPNLRRSEVLACWFEKVDDFNEYVRVIMQSNNPRYYELKVDLEEPEFYVEVINGDVLANREGEGERSIEIREWSHAIVSVGGESTGFFILIPQDVQKLTGRNCDGTTNLSDMGPLENLEELIIEEWKNLRVLCEEIIDVRDSPAPPFFRSLRVLEIDRCPKLKYLFGHGSQFYLPHLREIEISKCEEMVGITAAVTSPPPHPHPAFRSLEKIEIYECPKMKRVVESEWLPHFPILRKIRVSFCENMEEIIGGPPPYAPVEEISLESLEIYGCDNMRKLIPYEWLLHFRNLQTIDINGCKGTVELISRAGQDQEGSILTPVNNTSSSFQSSISLHVQKLTWRNCDGITNLSGMGSLEYLEELVIDEWENLGVLCGGRVLCGGQEEKIIDIHDSPAPTPTPPLFPCLRVLGISKCPKLKYLFGHGSQFYLPHLREIQISFCEEMVGITAAVTSPPPHPPPAFPSLEEIIVRGCDKMKRVVESEWLPHFPNLKSINVWACKNMEEIIGGHPPYMPVDEISLESAAVTSPPPHPPPAFPSLEVIFVRGCDKMKRVVESEWLSHFPNLKSIRVWACKNMEEIIGGHPPYMPVDEITLESAAVTSPPPHPPPAFPSLEKIDIYKCPKMKRVVESEWLPHFPNLREIPFV